MPYESHLISSMTIKTTLHPSPLLFNPPCELFCYNWLFVVIMAFGGKEINGYSFIDNLIDHTMLLVKPS